MGKIASSEEQYEASRHEIIPISEKKGQRTYVMLQPYIREPKLTLTVGLYTNPKYYADQDSPIGEVIGANHEGFREAQVGNAQAWYYHTDKTIVLWECFFDERFRTHPLIPSQDQLNRIENRLQRVTELLELLLGKIAQEDESIFDKLVRSDRFQQELKEGLEALKKDPAQFTDLYEAYRQQKTA